MRRAEAEGMAIFVFYSLYHRSIRPVCQKRFLGMNRSSFPPIRGVSRLNALLWTRATAAVFFSVFIALFPLALVFSSAFGQK
jgi:hypothetical protein